MVEERIRNSFGTSDLYVLPYEVLYQKVAEVLNPDPQPEPTIEDAVAALERTETPQVTTAIPQI
jgi:hypothetical protein